MMENFECHSLVSRGRKLWRKNNSCIFIQIAFRMYKRNDFNNCFSKVTLYIELEISNMYLVSLVFNFTILEKLYPVY